MKKTLVALAVSAFAAASAQAVTVYDNEGTSVVLDGRVHVVAEKATEKVKGQKSEGHSDLVNDGSRLRVTVKHNIGDSLYAIGRVETRFHGKDKAELEKNGTPIADDDKVVQGVSTGSANWGNLYIHRAYAGLGGEGHEVTFGKQLLIGDDIGLAGFDNHYGVGSAGGKIGGEAILTAAADSAINYTFTGVEGLKFGANYNFATHHDNNDDQTVKNGYGIGAVYEFDVADNQSVGLSAGYTHDNYEAAGNYDKDKDGVYFGAKYNVDNLTLAVDGGHAVVKTDDYKKKISFVRTGAKYKFDKTAVYGNYGYSVVKNGDAPKDRAHQYMLGVEHNLHKNVKVYTEGYIAQSKPNASKRVTERAIGAGLVVFW